MVADVLVEIQNIYTNKAFTYLIPNELLEVLKIGMRVEVSFGNSVLEGFVINIYKNNKTIQLKPIIRIVDEYVILNEELMHIGEIVSKETLTPLMITYQAMLPKALKAKNKVLIKEQYEKYISLNIATENLDNYKLNDKQLQIIEILLKNDKVKDSVVKSISVSSVNTLIKKGIIKETKDIKYRYNIEKQAIKKYDLNEEQLNVFNKIVKDLNHNSIFLLHGVTGSGKTNVYMEVIEKVIKRGKQALVLVPEISLTPQIIKRFSARFTNIAVLHSGLSDGEKYDEWRKINNNEVDIVIGARSAVFAPLKNIGIIIIDEEHSSTYKQDNMPRYNAIDVAKERSKYNNCPLILGSATPSLESYARAKKGIYQLLEINVRANKKEMPLVEIIDMNKEIKKTKGFLSQTLLIKIKEVLSKGEQVILFLNRRGYSNFLLCKNCGYVSKCPNCDISLTYHKSSNMLRCHYCGYAEKKKDNCPSCQGEITDYGIGTEKLEEEINKEIANAKVIRMDVDTTTNKNSHKKIIEDFYNEKYNVLLGTQMIAKGLDFPKVTLVGVVNADISLNIPDFRSSENTFQLLNQVSGRSGRDVLEGKVLIQTYNKDHYAVTYSRTYDYKSFYLEEMKIRKLLGYPPYYYLVGIKLISEDYDELKNISNKISDTLRLKLVNSVVLGPSLSNPFKLNNKYRMQLIIKYKKEKNLYEVISSIQNYYQMKKGLKIEIDFNPLKF